MKNLLIIILTILVNGTQVISQELLEIYKKGKVKLVEVVDYGNKNNWDSLFYDYNLVEDYGNQLGKIKKIIIAEDGSVFMSHKSHYGIWKFDKNGNFLNEFGPNGVNEVFDSESNRSITQVEGILDNKYAFTSSVYGKVSFFDLDGNFVKMLKLDYMPLQVIPLNNHKIAIVGFTNNKILVSIKDYITGNEKIILSEKELLDDGRIKIYIPNGGLLSFSLPYYHSYYLWYRIAASKNGNLLIASPKNGKVLVYSTEGVKLGEADLNITPLPITEADVKSIYETALKDKDEFEEQLKKNKKYNETEIQNIMTQYDNQLKKFINEKNLPAHLPYFSSLIVDSDGNIIVFEYTKEDVSNSFRAYTYDNNGKYICTSSFYNDNYELNFQPKSFAINNGYVYALATKNNCTGVCLRLVKFKMTQ